MNIKNEKVKDAFHNLILTHPFFASVLLQQEIVEDNTKETFCVDGKHLFYNDEFANSLTFDECKGVLAHECLHIVLLHFSRQQNRNSEIWNKATDFSINDQLIKSGFVLPKGALVDNSFANKSSEDIYKIIYQKEIEEQKKNGGKSKDGNSNKQKDKSNFGEVIQTKTSEKDAEEVKIQIKQAESFAKLCGNMPGELARHIAELREPKYDWREILNRFLNEVCAKDYCFSRPNRRYIQSGFVMPSLYNQTFGNIIFVVDTSGSVSQEELENAVKEVFGCLEVLLESRNNIELPVIYCDSKVQGIDILNSENDKPKVVGGGGTRYKPAFDYIKQNKDGYFDNPAAILYLTDGINGCEQIEEPNCPVLWLVTTDKGLKNYKRPFGEDIKFDINQ